MRLYRIFMLCVLCLTAIYQMHILYQHWRTLPTRDLHAWRLEYADINFDQVLTLPTEEVQEGSGKMHTLEVQLQVAQNALHPLLQKNFMLPNLELLLTNVDGQAIAYQEFTPTEWLGRDAAKDIYLTRGVMAPSQITVKIPITLSEAASGFQVQMVYPN